MQSHFRDNLQSLVCTVWSIKTWTILNHAVILRIGVWAAFWTRKFFIRIRIQIPVPDVADLGPDPTHLSAIDNKHIFFVMHHITDKMFLVQSNLLSP
jgi:hypothetical protein